MALVLRSAVVGPAIGVATVGAGSATRPPNGAAPPGTQPDETAVAVGVAPVTGRAEESADAAAASPTPPAGIPAILAATGLILAGTAMASPLANRTEPFRFSDPAATFGLMLVLATAVERLLEPFTQRLPGRHAKAAYERAVARLANHDRHTTTADVAHAKARMQRARADRVVVMWGLATAVATVVCAATGFFLLRALEQQSDWDGVSRLVDALVTGLIVGSGTKPVHDLVTRLQLSKDAKEDKG